MQDQKQGIKGMFDIMFTKDTNVLKIPTLEVNDETESFFRNFMAYEQFISSGESTYVSLFMDNLINTCKDVQLLCKCGTMKWLPKCLTSSETPSTCQETSTTLRYLAG
ncbi:hypothetical protein GQ457_16G008180 [Hibiscus cannabinus]